jgi:hypothetical protein
MHAYFAHIMLAKNPIDIYSSPFKIQFLRKRLARSVCKKIAYSACKTFYARTFAKLLHLEKKQDKMSIKKYFLKTCNLLTN